MTFFIFSLVGEGGGESEREVLSELRQINQLRISNELSMWSFACNKSGFMTNYMRLLKS